MLKHLIYFNFNIFSRLRTKKLSSPTNPVFLPFSVGREGYDSLTNKNDGALKYRIPSVVMGEA